jgi:hypothetical protein
MPIMPEQFDSPELTAIQRLFDTYDLDLVMFNSCVKVGNTRNINASTF